MAFSASAASGVTTAGSGEYSTFIASAASIAIARVLATTNATGSPWCRTRFLAITGRGGLTSGGSLGIWEVFCRSPKPASVHSVPVIASKTPAKSLTWSTSTEMISACACGERTTTSCAMPGLRRLAVYRPWPVMKRWSSSRPWPGAGWGMALSFVSAGRSYRG